MTRNYVNNDPMNQKKKRNIKNTPKYLYNCGGYALNCFSWYIPTSEEEAIPTTFCAETDQDIKEITQKCVNYMLNEISTLRVYNGKNPLTVKLNSDEYLIAFRISSGGDFHFLKRASNNHWFHKRGGSYYIDTIKTSKIFDNWDFSYNYDGPIVFLINKICQKY